MLPVWRHALASAAGVPVSCAAVADLAVIGIGWADGPDEWAAVVAAAVALAPHRGTSDGGPAVCSAARRLAAVLLVVRRRKRSDHHRYSNCPSAADAAEVAFAANAQPFRCDADPVAAAAAIGRRQRDAIAGSWAE